MFNQWLSGKPKKSPELIQCESDMQYQQVVSSLNLVNEALTKFGMSNTIIEQTVNTINNASKGNYELLDTNITIE